MSKMKTLTRLTAALALAASAGAAQAQSYGANISTEAAKKVSAGTLAECAKNNWRVAVAVVDTAGALVHFERIDDTQIASIEIAIAKARAAATFRTAGVEVVPVPCNFLTTVSTADSPLEVKVPSWNGCEKISIWMHEFIGWRVYRNRGWITE